VSVPEPSYEELAALVVKMTAHLEQAGARITALEAEVAALRARLGRDSTNSSTPPSADSLAAKGKRKAARSQRVRSVDRKRGGQPGRRGSGLTPTQDPDRTERVAGLESCTGCGSGLSDAHGVGHTWGQVWDLTCATFGDLGRGWTPDLRFRRAGRVDVRTNRAALGCGVWRTCAR
jgi:transposase